MPDLIVTLPAITSLAIPAVDSSPSLVMSPIQEVPRARSIPPLRVIYPASPVGRDGVPMATVTITDTAPQPPVYAAAPSQKPWWRSPLGLGLLAGGFLLLVVLTKEN